MLNVLKLKAKIVENGLTVQDLAAAIHMNTATFYRRLGDKGESFTVREVSDIVGALNLTVAEANEIFFNNFVA